MLMGLLWYRANHTLERLLEPQIFFWHSGFPSANRTFMVGWQVGLSCFGILKLGCLQNDFECLHIFAQWIELVRPSSSRLSAAWVSEWNFWWASAEEDALGAIKQVLDVPQHIFIDSSQSLRDLQPNSSCRSVWAKKTMLQAQAQVVQSRKFLF